MSDMHASQASSEFKQVLDIVAVSKAYDNGKSVLDEVSLTLNRGEIFGLIGLNGVGKTTLIKMMLDLTNIDSGSIEIFGQSPSHVASRQHLSYLPEKFQPSRYLIGHEYLSLAMSYYGKPFHREAAAALVEALDLAPEALDKKVGSYSKGMGQKLGLAGAFLTDQPLLILDEPMSGLDPKARIKLKKLMLAKKAAGMTIFFSSHILSDIDEICDRIGIIHHAKLQYLGTPAEFKQHYNGESLEKSFLCAIDEAA